MPPIHPSWIPNLWWHCSPGWIARDGLMSLLTAVMSLWKGTSRRKANLHQRARDWSSEAREGLNLIILLLSVRSEGLEGVYFIKTKVRIFVESDNSLKNVSPQLCALSQLLMMVLWPPSTDRRYTNLELTRNDVCRHWKLNICAEEHQVGWAAVKITTGRCLLGLPAPARFKRQFFLHQCGQF